MQISFGSEMIPVNDLWNRQWPNILSLMTPCLFMPFEQTIVIWYYMLPVIYIVHRRASPSSTLCTVFGIWTMAHSPNRVSNTYGKSATHSVRVQHISKRRSLHSLGNSIWIPYGLGGFHPPVHGFHMDYFLAGSPAIFSFHTHYGFHMDCTWNGAFHGPVHGESIWIPYGFHGISSEFQLWIHVLFHMESMDQSIWNPWNSPYGFHTWNP